MARSEREGRFDGLRPSGEPWFAGSPPALEPEVRSEPPPRLPGAASVAGPPSQEPSPELFAFAGDDHWEPLPAGAGSLRTIVSGLASMLIHLVGLIALGLLITAEVDEIPPLSPLIVSRVLEDERELETVFLDEQITPGTHLTSPATTFPVPSSQPWAPDDVRLPQLTESPDIALDWPKDHEPGIEDLLARVRRATTGTAEAVDGYEQALDRITQELLELLAKRKVLLIWCFDQSGSMKDDQQEIRARLERVYAELGMTGAASDNALLTAVASYGRDALSHTDRPTADLEVIREAIDAVPVDPSGEEMTLGAVIRTLTTWQEFAKRQGRQMAMILVTDESGNREENDTYLEAAIGQALAARSKVYVLGREAVFGYPYAHIRWVHPETKRVHELPVDRGPETAFTEVLKSEGFEPRRDAHPSGFGPYALSRLAWRTGGIFFMLPSVESDLIGGEKRRYAWERMQPYRPDLRSREEILAEAQRHPLRPLIWKIVDDLDPHQPKVARMTSMRRAFSADLGQFRAQVQEARSMANLYFAGLERAIRMLDEQEPARDREPSLRWQANYDLIRAQVVAYAARVHLYRTALEEAAKKLIVTPTTQAPNKQLVAWRMRKADGPPGDEAVTEMLERSRDLYLAVIGNHAGTPWAARAEWELNRDFNYPLSASPEPEAGDADTGPRSSDDDGSGSGAGSASGASGWGLAWYRGVELVPEYGVPRPPAPPAPGPARP
ncbi:MAG: vWA domain-containing protein, partial [Planctomycetota bacterium]